METGKYTFEVNLNLGCDCAGQFYNETLYADVVFTPEEEESIRTWLKGHKDKDYQCLKSDLPDIFSKIKSSVAKTLWWWAAEDGIANDGYEDKGHELFEKEVRSGAYEIEGVNPDEFENFIDDEDFDALFEEWEWTKDDLDDDKRAEYLDERYNITGSTDFSAIEYNVSFPEDLI